MHEKILYNHLFLKQYKYIYFSLTEHLLSASSFESKENMTKNTCPQINYSLTEEVG